MRGPLVLALLLATAPVPGLAQSAAAGPHSLTVALSSFRFTPAVLTLHQGERYRIRFDNTASGGHDFVAKDFFADSTIAPEDAAKIRGGKIDLAGGESVQITLTPNRAGHYKVHCSHFMHSAFGMKGEIVVEP